MMLLKIDINKWFSWLNLGIKDPSTASAVEVLLQIVVICLIAFLFTFFLRKGITRVIGGMVRRTKTKWDDIFFEERVFQKIFNLIPPIFIDFAFKIVYGKWQHVERGLDTRGCRFRDCCRAGCNKPNLRFVPDRKRSSDKSFRAGD